MPTSWRTASAIDKILGEVQDYSYQLRPDRGAIAGRLHVFGGAGKFRDLSGARVLLGDRRAARVESDGSFYVVGLPEGVYRVSLDAADLPLELRPVKPRLNVEVKGGGITRVSFALRAEYGIAGRVRKSGGTPLTGFRLELSGADGFAKTTRTDQFGLYRIDGLPPGEYLLRAAPENFQHPPSQLPSRTIRITSEFLFSQDLVIPLPHPG